MLNKASITWSCKQIKGMVNNGKIDFPELQRGSAWNKKKKTYFIDSLINGYPIPQMYASRITVDENVRGGNKYFLLDGKQRSTTIAEFLNDEFPLGELPEITYRDEDADMEFAEDISGLKFSELPEVVKDIINTTTISIVYYDALTDEEERQIFKRLNNGQALSVKNRTLANCKNLGELLELGNHPLFDQMLTAKAKENKNQVHLIMKMYVMMTNDVENISFASKDFNPVVENAELTDDDKGRLEDLFDYVVAVHSDLMERKSKVAKKIYTETHLVSFVPFMIDAMENQVDAEHFADFVEDFFDVPDSEYTDACGAGSAKNANIVTRNNVINRYYNKEN